MLILANEIQSYDVILIISLMILLGLFVGRIAEKHHIPNITGYIIVGIVFGLGIYWWSGVALLGLFMYITKFALGFIALSIGLELDFRKIWNRRNEVLIVTIVQAVSAFIFTAIGLRVFGFPLHYALLLGTIAIATEPGPILFLTKRYKTKGELTDTLVPLHGVEDAFAIIIFGIVLSYAIAVEQGQSLSLIMILHGPIYELIFSLFLGIAIGIILRIIIRKLDYEDVDKDMVVFVSAFVAIMFSIALAIRGFDFFGAHVHLSPVLLPMVVGITFANTSSKLAKDETEHMLDLFSPPILIGFFTIIGAEMVFLLISGTADIDWSRFLLYATVYIVFRIFGKLFGSYVGGLLGKSTKNVRKYLGFCLLPQAQAAIGLIFYAGTRLSNSVTANMMILIVIAGTLVYELLGPFGLRHSFIRCDEVDEHGACIIKQKRKT